MATTDIDHDKLQKQLAILMQNSTAFSSVMYKLLVTSEPMDVEVNVFTDENTFETIKVPNRAKGSIPALYGAGVPEEVQTASYGALYIDTNSSNVYIKTTSGGSTGWLLLATEQNIQEHNMNTSAHDGVLAQVHGNTSNYFEVADLIANDAYNGKYAVNKDSLDKIVGNLSNAAVNDKSNVVAALNEVIELNNYDTGCMVSGGVKAIDGSAAGLILDNSILKVVSPFIIVSSKGRKYTYTETISINLNSKDYGEYAVYLDLDSSSLVLLSGEYYVSSVRPYFLAVGDCWLNISNAPYKFLKLEYITSSNTLELKEKNYVFLGRVEWRG